MSQYRQENIADRIKKALSIKGMRQAELCKLANIPKSSLSQYLSGDFEPKQDRIYLMAKALNVSEAWLMGFDVPMERQEQKKSPASETMLTEGEKMWLGVYNKLSDETKQLLASSLNEFSELTQEQQELALKILRVTVEAKK